MNGHTPGPWRVEQANGDVFGIEHLGLSPVVYTKFLILDDGVVSAVIAATIPTHAEFNATAEANARLIASAPNLLAACKAALDFLDVARSDLKHRGETEAQREALRSAIAQAETAPK